MAAEQVQIRRDSNTNLIAATPTQGELGYDTTNNRIVVGNGSKSGGSPIPTYADIQNQVFGSVTGGGTADAQTLTFTTHWAPTAYAARQRFSFIAGATNTTTCTLNVNALGAKTIKKVEAGALVNLAAGDITSGRPYDVYYDGTYMVMMNASAGVPDGAVSNASLEDAAAGDYIVAIAYADDTDTTPGVSYVKYAELIAPRDGTYRVRVRVDAIAGDQIYGKAYINGTTAGTQVLSASNPAYQNDDLTVSAGDLVQLFLRGTSSGEEYETGNHHPAIALMEASPINGGALYTTEAYWQ